MKEYIYKPSHYMIQMTIPGVFTVMIGLFCIYQLLFGMRNILFVPVLLICLYNVWNLFVSNSNPSRIMFDDETLTFSSFRKTHSYKLNEIQSFAMRPLSGNQKLYMVINNGGITGGRFWVRTGEFNDSEELNDFFYDLDARVNPDSLFTQARSQGRERLKKNKESK